MRIKKLFIVLFVVTSSLFLLMGCQRNERFANSPNVVDMEGEKNSTTGDIESSEKDIDTNKIDSFENDNVEVDKDSRHKEDNSIDTDKSIHGIYGTWSLEKVALVSEVLMFPPEEETNSPDLIDDTDAYVGLELEITDKYLRLGENKFFNPKYNFEYMTLKEFNDGGDFKLPDAYSFILDENISIINNDNYESPSEVPLKVYQVEFDKDYNIPVGTQFVVLNNDTMFIGLWGKVILARRVGI